MKIQYVSDLHLEFTENTNYIKKNPIKPTGDILILAGDITLFKKQRNSDWFFDYCSENWKQTYWIPGNHEFYYSEMGYATHYIRKNVRDNVMLVQSAVELIDNVALIFSTLWTNVDEENIEDIQNGMGDYRVIKYYDSGNLEVSDTNYLHWRDKLFIEESLETYKGFTKVVVTHHKPTFQNNNPIYEGNRLSQAFSVDLDDLIIKSKPDYWIYGHNHYNAQDFKIGDTVLLTNQLGYVKHCEHLDFNSNKFIEI